MQIRIRLDALARRTAALVLQRDAGDLPGEALADQPGDSQCGLIVAKPRAVDVGNAIALGIGDSGRGAKVR